MKQIEQLSGDTIAVNAQGGTVRVEGAQVIKTDIQASNGVIERRWNES